MSNYDTNVTVKKTRFYMYNIILLVGLVKSFFFQKIKELCSFRKKKVKELWRKGLGTV